MSRVRGGENSTEIRVASKRVISYVNRIDILLALSEGAVPHLENRITSKTLIIGDEMHLKSLPKEKYNFIGVKFLEKAKEMGRNLHLFKCNSCRNYSFSPRCTEINI